MKAKRWTPAVRNYTKALEITNDATVRTKLRNARDEQAFATTTQKNTIDSYEKYLSDFPSGLHKKEADRILQLSYLAVARTYVKENNYDKAVFYYQTYQERYPFGPEIATVNKELCDFYVAEAQKAEKIKKASSARRALELYARAEECGNRTSQSHLKSLRRKATRWSRTDLVFVGWHADGDNPIGVMVGSLNNPQVGIYLSGRSNSGFFKTASDWETDSQNSLQESVNQDKEFTGEIIPREIHINAGLTKRVVHPFYLFAGAGLTINDELRQFRSSTGIYEEYVVNKDAKYTSFNPEGGVYIWLGPVVLRYGINKPLHERYTGGLMHNFGLAIKFDK